MINHPYIVIVDDDDRLRSLISTYLTKEGFNVFPMASGEDALKIVYEKQPNLIILDINLQGMDGLSVCRRLRNAGIQIPIIMLTARGEESDRIHGLEIGADDYLTKPFNPRELVARIRAVLRRQPISGFGLYETDSVVYQFSEFELDMKKQSLLKGGEDLRITSGEFALLHLLILGGGKPLSRDQLAARMASREHHPDQRAIDMLVSRLRKRLDVANANESLIRTLRGVGYILVADTTIKK